MLAMLALAKNRTRRLKIIKLYNIILYLTAKKLQFVLVYLETSSAAARGISSLQENYFLFVVLRTVWTQFGTR